MLFQAAFDNPVLCSCLTSDLHNIESQGSRIEVVTEITEDGNKPMNKLILEESNDYSIL